MMAGWTQQDVDLFRDAVRKLATGQRVVTVAYAGPPARSVTYYAVELDKLRELLAEAERTVAGSATPRFRRAAFSKGF